MQSTGVSLKYLALVSLAQWTTDFALQKTAVRTVSLGSPLIKQIDETFVY